MRIWIINHYGSPPIMPGGTRHYNFAQQLQKRGHEVIIISANYNHFTHAHIVDPTSSNTLDRRYEIPFVWIPVPAYKGNTISRFLNMILFGWRLLHNKILKSMAHPDVIIGSSPHLFAAFGAEVLSRRLKKPFILEIRDVWPETLVDLGRFTSTHPLIKGMKWIERYLYRRATKIISLLPNVNEYLIGCGVHAKNICWIPNMVDTSTIPDLPKIKKSTFTVMYAGAHGVANNLDIIIFAAKILQEQELSKHIKICLIGEGPEKNRIRELAKQHNIGCIEFLDAVPKTEIYFTLNQADAFIMPLKDSPVFRWGISPNKLFDYLFMERPVIFAVNTPYNPIEICQAGITIDPNNPQALADAILKLSQLPNDELHLMGKRGKEYILQNHNIAQLTDSLEDLLKSVTCS